MPSISLKFCLKIFCWINPNTTAKHTLLPAIKWLHKVLIKSLTYFDAWCWMGHWEYWFLSNRSGICELAAKCSSSLEPCSLKISIYYKSNTNGKHAHLWSIYIGSNNEQLTSSSTVFATLCSSITLRDFTSASQVAADPKTVESESCSSQNLSISFLAHRPSLKSSRIRSKVDVFNLKWTPSVCQSVTSFNAISTSLRSSTAKAKLVEKKTVKSYFCIWEKVL